MIKGSGFEMTIGGETYSLDDLKVEVVGVKSGPPVTLPGKFAAQFELKLSEPSKEFMEFIERMARYTRRNQKGRTAARVSRQKRARSRAWSPMYETAYDARGRRVGYKCEACEGEGEIPYFDCGCHPICQCPESWPCEVCGATGVVPKRTWVRAA